MPADLQTKFESSLSPQAPTTPKAVSFQVELDRGEGLASIGLQLDASDQKLCLVTGVKADGLVHRWNTQNPGQKVLRFDRLLQVNGEPGPADTLVAKACSSTKLLLAFQRPRTFQARVQKRGRALGLRIAVNSQHPSAIAVIQVEAEGAMEEWNRSNPNLAVQASDRFLEVYPVGESAVVEGEAATASGMLRTLQNSDDVCLTVLSWRSVGLSNEDFINAMGSIAEDASLAGVVASLTRLAEELVATLNVHRGVLATDVAVGEFAPHPLLYWVRLAKKTDEAQGCLDRINSSLEYELAQIRDSFRRFDHDGSGHLDTQEFLGFPGQDVGIGINADIDDDDNAAAFDGQRPVVVGRFKFMCAYIGWGEEEASVMDLDNDSKVTLDEFQRFVGHMGGLQQLFQQRRQRAAWRMLKELVSQALSASAFRHAAHGTQNGSLQVARKQWGVEAPAIIEVGARVQAGRKVDQSSQDGQKSANLREAQVLELNVMPSNGEAAWLHCAMAIAGHFLMLVFGFGEGRDARQERQVVPPNWIFSDTRDSDVVAALREEQQGFWASIFPESEMRAVQRAALANVRANAALNHDKALPDVRDRFTRLGYGEAELQGVLGWIQDLAPMCVHIHIGTVGRFLETDEYYRSQFETGTSCGALDDKNQIRIGWETELFGGAYDEAKPFERCKYGALGVMNDYRGITSAYQYGDSYLVLKDVRLRATFAATDSGGIAGSRLAVLDKYAHVLKEYNDNELHRLIEVAMANTSLDDVPRIQPQLLRGLTADTTNDWVTMGFPDLPQKKGRYYFEIELIRGCQSPQVGLLSSRFELAPRTKGQHLYGDIVDRRAREGHKESMKDGDWDEEATPSFGPNLLPKGSNLYPALSFKGRAQLLCLLSGVYVRFNFGPDFKHAPPSFKGKAFAHWPGMPDGIIRADCPIIGNSNNVNIYKEIQLHGEVNLKRNVQRLVANRKHLEVSKSDRSWAVRVDGMDDADGLVAWVALPDVAGYPIAFHMEVQNKKAEGRLARRTSGSHKRLETILSSSSDNKGGLNWIQGRLATVGSSHESDRGVCGLAERPVKLFRSVMAKLGLSNDKQDELVKSLAEKASDAEEEEVFRVGESTTFLDEWTKLQTARQVQVTSEEAWEACLQAAHDEDVHIASASKLRVNFSSRCQTNDDCASLQVLAGGLSKSAAGVGARAHLKAITGPDQAPCRVTGIARIVNIDKDESEIWEWLDSNQSPGRNCTAVCAMEAKVVKIKQLGGKKGYSSGQKIGDEIAGFTFNEASPMTPFSVAGFSKPGGPAQLKGVFAGWFVDVIALIKFRVPVQLKKFKSLEGEGFGEAPKNLAEIAANIEGFKKRMNALLEVSDMTPGSKFLEGWKMGFCQVASQVAADSSPSSREPPPPRAFRNVTFYNGLDFQLLPVCAADYKDASISDEIDGFNSTFNLEENKQVLGDLTPQQALEDPELLRQLSGIKLMLEPANAEPEELFTGYGDDDWTPFIVPINNAQFVFSTDGDGSNLPLQGVSGKALCRSGRQVVTDADKPEPAESKIEELVEAYTKASARIIGSNLAQVSIEPEDWDEDRLKALCARHGWEFEWMTEEDKVSKVSAEETKPVFTRTV
ncbi:hypothetical protein AK812_SmicGene16255 [Symbiodinium microadriaticum]|uniref:EF-hand domain-containing protein n=1 Tax=Symbiodinium microadriaticum TaxID=2951 RepID=A0A1Q9E0Q8_SYMMI|nr:hypothetical protein AK812_SmicGene16255 [Symbiodinium microadriaticum]